MKRFAHFMTRKRVVRALFEKEIVFYKRVGEIDNLLIGTLDPLRIMNIMK